MTEQVKYLKCIKSDEESFTEGRVYEVLREYGGTFTIVDDDGDLRQRPLARGVIFEIIEKYNQEEPTNTKELKPRDLGCFRQVADVIGEYAAEIELQKVIDCGVIESPAHIESVRVSGAFTWRDSPQGIDFWDAIEDGYTPKGYVQQTSQEVSEQSEKDSGEPKFGDVVHVNGESVVFIRVDPDGDYEVVTQEGEANYVDLKQIDEYAPNPHQEQRGRILKRWQRKTLDNAMDTEVCIAEMRVSDLIDFVQENILAET